jgi:hypothetical protein
MKRCPSCNRTYTDEALNFCLEDGTPLAADGASTADTNETMRYPVPGRTAPVPPSGYQPAPQSSLTAPAAPPHGYQQPQWSPAPVLQPRKSNAVWWVLGGLGVVVVLGIGIVIVILAVASISSQSNRNRVITVNSNNRNSNRIANTNNSNSLRTNTNTTVPLPASFSDDFSSPKWSTGNSQFGDLWYVNDEYHMRSKDQTYTLMYGPSNDYNTENATVKVTVRNVDGVSPTSGYGLVVHGERSKEDQLEDYGFLIYSGAKPQYKVVMHKGGTETELVSWAPSSTIRQGTSTNQLEVRITGPMLSFYINGQFVKSITDTANFKRGRAGLYTSDAHEVAFDDLEIKR